MERKSDAVDVARASDTLHTGDLFAGRRKLMTAQLDVQRLADKLRANLASHDSDGLRRVIEEQHPADLADAMLILNDQEDLAVFKALAISEAAEVLDEVDSTTEANLVRETTPDQLAAMLNLLPADEGADIVGALTHSESSRVLDLARPGTADKIRTLLAYPHYTAGGVMSLGYVAVPETATQAEALEIFRSNAEADPVFYIYLVDEDGGLVGSINLRRLLSAEPATPVRTLLDDDLLVVPPDCPEEQVANIFARYDITALPVVATVEDAAGPAPAAGIGSRLLGVITSDDIIDILQAEHAESVARMSGSDARELEQKTPVQVARLRLPWIMATMFIELLAGVVIHIYDRTLTEFILLASFMPIISAISGNTGLQSAAIIIRGLSAGVVQLSHWQRAVMRQLVTSALLGGACGLVLGAIGVIWSGEWVFGLVIFLGMFLAVNIAGIVGTVVPMTSKRLGFDPALTAGPFETAFQDVIGISIFLSLATVLLHWLG
jgi:magnesium transporter